MVKMLEASGLAVLVLALLAGCGGSSEPKSADAVAADRARAANLLEGAWVLVDFRPEQPLEPMFAGLLAAQLGTMIVTFDQGAMYAQGVGISTQHTYQVMEAAGDNIKLAVYDPTRVSYEVSGNFHGNELAFSALTPPWRGTGRLRRRN